MLKLKTAKKYCRGWNKDNNADVFRNYLNLSSNEKIPYRIYVSLDDYKDDLNFSPPSSIRNFLKRHGYKITSFNTVKDGKNHTKIGKILNKKRATKAIKKTYSRYIERCSSRNINNLMLVISRHPYDIAGCSTDRNWTSCLNIKDGCEKGSLKYEIKSKTMICYLVNKNDPNIENPLGRILIRRVDPFIFNFDFCYLRTETTYYGNLGFSSIVKKALEPFIEKNNNLIDKRCLFKEENYQKLTTLTNITDYLFTENYTMPEIKHTKPLSIDDDFLVLFRNIYKKTNTNHLIEYFLKCYNFNTRTFIWVLENLKSKRLIERLIYNIDIQYIDDNTILDNLSSNTIHILNDNNFIPKDFFKNYSFDDFIKISKNKKCKFKHCMKFNEIDFENTTHIDFIKNNKNTLYFKDKRVSNDFRRKFVENFGLEYGLKYFKNNKIIDYALDIKEIRKAMSLYMNKSEIIDMYISNKKKLAA